jgi:putative tricarboxylic transport membrane protein
MVQRDMVMRDVVERGLKEGNMKLERFLIALALICFSATGWTQSWLPQRNVEIVVGAAPGGVFDKTARTLERLLVANKLVNSTITVVNKPGGGQNIAHTYVSQRPGDGHTLMVFGPPLLTNHIRGASPLNYTDFTPIASLFNEYIVFAVNAASPIRTGKDLLERLKKDPKSVTIGFASIGSAPHLSAGLLHKAIGGNTRDLKVVSFKGMAEAITSLLGGHLDLVITPASTASGHVAAGTMRMVGAAAPRRFGGALANVPTWKEQGVNLVSGTWRAMMGPKGLSAAQTAYWEGALRKATEFPEWKADLEKNYWSDDFVTGAQFRKDLDKDYADTKAVLVDLGLAKQ